MRPLSDAALHDLIRGYVEYATNDRVDLFWTSDHLRHLVDHAPEAAYLVIRELVRLAPTPYVLGIIAAGELEDPLSHWGELLIDRLEIDAREDPKLMAACAGVWKLWMSEEVWDRLQRLVGGTDPSA
jgi:hypothetical protein